MNPDPELEELFPGGPGRELVQLIQASRPAQPPLDPYFRNHLRMKVIAEARRRGTARPGSRFAWPSLRVMSFAAAACAVVLVVGVVLRGGTPVQPVAVTQAPQGMKNVSRVEPIRIAFTGPVDKNAVAQSIAIEPATLYTTRWDGQTLVIIPLHALAANTSYSVKLVPVAQPAANTTPTTTPAPPVVVHFVTAPVAPSPVSPPSFRTDNLTVFEETPMAQPGAVVSAAWMPDSQALIVTTPAAEVWWMNPQGTLVRRLAAHAGLPSVAPDGRHLAFWRSDETNHASLWVSAIDDDGSHATQVASLPGTPTGPAAWIGKDRLAYGDGGTQHLVDLQGTQLPLNVAIVPGSPVAATADGHILAMLTAQGPTVLDTASGRSQVIMAGTATDLAWSTQGQLAFILSQPSGSQLWVDAPDGLKKVAESTAGAAWSGISWSPDASSLLVGTRGAAADALPGAFLVNAEAAGKVVAFGAADREYGLPRWAPDGSSVAFLRGDETGRPRLWMATVRVGQLSAADLAQLDAIHVVTRFLDARQAGHLADAQSALGPQALATYQNGNLPLVTAPGDPIFARSYVVGVQLVSSDQFLITVRIVLADPKSKQETKFFEEHLTVVRHDQRFLIDAVQPGTTTTLGQGPSVVSVQVQRVAPNQRIDVKFDADLKPSTVSRDNVFLRDAAGQTVQVADFQFDPNTRTVSIVAKLRAGNYTLVVTTAITDVNGQASAQEYDYAVVISPSTD